MNFTVPLYSVAAPEMFVLIMACMILVIDVFLSDKHKIITYVLVQFTLVCAFLLVLTQYRIYPQSVVTFDGHYILDKLSVLTKLFVLTASSFCFIYARDYIKARHISRGSYYTLGLFAVLGMLVMASGYSLLSIYLGLELLSMPLYAMVALYKSSEKATEAAIKYFVLGALASGLLLFGISLLYGATGHLGIAEIANQLNQNKHAEDIVILGLVFIIAGLIFKFGAFPFHMWVPDVYQGAATTVTLFIASAPKIATFCITMRILVAALPGMVVPWQHVLIVIAILSMFFGNLMAIAQTNFKRMLAYSSIAHIGYTLLGLVAGPYSNNGYSAAMFYITTYVLVAAGAFAIVALLSKEGMEFDQLDDYRGLNARNPWLAFLMLLLMFSMAGVPPTVGFFAKLGLLEALVEAHYVWLAALALLFAIVGAYYYLRVVMLMYFEEPREKLRGSYITVSPGIMAAITVNGIAALFFGVFPSWLIDVCRISVG